MSEAYTPLGTKRTKYHYSCTILFILLYFELLMKYSKFYFVKLSYNDICMSNRELKALWPNSKLTNSKLGDQ